MTQKVNFLQLQRSACMVRRAADWTAQDWSAGVTLSWDQEVYDDDAYHDLVTNPDRLTVPVDGDYRVGCTITLGNVSVGTDFTVAVRKNGATSYDGTIQEQIDAATTAPAISISGGRIPCVAGDYFTVAVFTVGDPSVDLTAARSSFWIERVSG